MFMPKPGFGFFPSRIPDLGLKKKSQGEASVPLERASTILNMKLQIFSFLGGHLVGSGSTYPVKSRSSADLLQWNFFLHGSPYIA
jgi:hypothetical protein